MSRIAATLNGLKAQGRKALIPYVTAGDPFPEATPEVDRSGRRVTYGRSSLTRERQLWLLHLEGSPEEIGDVLPKLVAEAKPNVDAAGNPKV